VVLISSMMAEDLTLPIRCANNEPLI